MNQTSGLRGKSRQLDPLRITQKVKKAYVRWAEDGRRVYVNSEGRQVSPWKGADWPGKAEPSKTGG